MAVAALVVAAQAPLEAGIALTDGQFDDPFAYCAAVGTVDAPDARYTGPALPEAVARGLQAALDMPAGAEAEPLPGNWTWRCMDRQVYACTFGANLPCAEKADTRTAPSAAVREFCRQNSGAEVIPKVVTGRATAFEWRCAGERPSVVRQFGQPDAAGYLANIWYPIEPATVKGPYSTRLQPLRRAGGRDRRCYVPLREAREDVSREGSHRGAEGRRRDHPGRHRGSGRLSPGVREHTERLVLIEVGPHGTTCARVGCMPSLLLIAAEAATGVAMEPTT